MIKARQIKGQQGPLEEGQCLTSAQEHWRRVVLGWIQILKGSGGVSYVSSSCRTC